MILLVNWKKALLSVVCSVLIFLVPAYAADKTLEAEAGDNPYIAQYFLEKQANPRKNDLVDSEVEDRIAIDALTSYFNADVKVAGILASYEKEANLLEKATSLKQQDKIHVMHKILKVYESIANPESKEELVGFLERYARNIQDVKSVTFLKEINTNDTTQNNFSMLLAYDGTAAGTWAYNNWNSYDSAFPAFNAGWGSDCTNFMSQALYHGGKAMAGDWYSYKKNSTYQSPTSATQLNYSWTLADPSPWISVEEFNDYWRPLSTVYGYSKASYIANHASIYNNPIYKGDVVVFHNGTAGFITWATHIMIISGYDTPNSDFLLAGHSNNRQAYPLLTAIDSYSYIEFLIIP